MASSWASAPPLQEAALQAAALQPWVGQEEEEEEEEDEEEEAWE